MRPAESPSPDTRPPEAVTTPGTVGFLITRIWIGLGVYYTIIMIRNPQNPILITKALTLLTFGLQINMHSAVRHLYLRNLSKVSWIQFLIALIWISLVMVFPIHVTGPVDASAGVAVAINCFHCRCCCWPWHHFRSRRYSCGYCYCCCWCYNCFTIGLHWKLQLLPVIEVALVLEELEEEVTQVCRGSMKMIQAPSITITELIKDAMPHRQHHLVFAKLPLRIARLHSCRRNKQGTLEKSSMNAAGNIFNAWRLCLSLPYW